MRRRRQRETQGGHSPRSHGGRAQGLQKPHHGQGQPRTRPTADNQRPGQAGVQEAVGRTHVHRPISKTAGSQARRFKTCPGSSSSAGTQSEGESVVRRRRVSKRPVALPSPAGGAGGGGSPLRPVVPVVPASLRGTGSTGGCARPPTPSWLRLETARLRL